MGCVVSVGKVLPWSGDGNIGWMCSFKFKLYIFESSSPERSETEPLKNLENLVDSNK